MVGVLGVQPRQALSQQCALNCGLDPLPLVVCCFFAVTVITKQWSEGEEQAA